MISNEHKEDIVHTGISFMRAITEAYGNDEGLKLWDAIGSTLDPDVRGHILFAMLTGDFSGRIRVTGTVHGVQMVPAIKAIRAATNWGLKEAKDAVDALRELGRPIVFECHHAKRGQIVSDLRAAGLIV